MLSVVHIIPLPPGIPLSLCSVLLVMNVDMFTLSGHGSFTGFLFDEHSGPQPAGGNSFNMMNVTNVLVEGVTISHFDGSMWIHFSQNIMVRNVTLYNRNTPEETGASRAKSASRSLQRALLMPRVNPGSLSRCGKRT